MSDLTTIKIGPVTYRVERVLRLLGSNGDGTSTWLNGRVSYEKLLIELEQELPEQLVPIALVHETVTAWERAYPRRKVKNAGYCTHGVLVPLREFEALADAVWSL